MSNYLTENYKGKYRIKANYDLRTNQFPRKLNGNLEDVDCYIDCQKGIRIHHFGHSTLEVYIPSLQQGRNVLRFIYRDYINKSNTNTNISEYDVERKDGNIIHMTKETVLILDSKLYEKELNNNNFIFNIEESDSEVLFQFKAKDMDKLEKYFEPKTNGADISPFSPRNLPKNKDYKIPDEILNDYKQLVKNIPKNNMLLLGLCTKNFLKSLATKKNTWENIRADMTAKGLKGKEYIHSIGEWNDYIHYLEKELEKEI